MKIRDAHADAKVQFDVGECEERCMMYAINDVEPVAAVVVVKPMNS